jgi:voltage-gated sodium channel
MTERTGPTHKPDHEPTNPFRRLVEKPVFNHVVTGIILFAALLIGLETYPGLVARYGEPLKFLHRLVLGIFIAEIALRMAAEGRRTWRYFLDPWNLFDVAIVGASFIPAAGEYVMAVRLLRLLRVLRLVRTVPDLQVIIGALVRSIPSMGYVMVLLLLLFYVYAVAGTFLFRANDPVHFENLQISFLTLFRVMTLEDWTDVLYIQIYGCDRYGYGDFPERCTSPATSPVLSPIYFVSFVLLGTMIFLNLFIGIIVNSMEEVRKSREMEKMRREGHSLALDLGLVNEQLAELQTRLQYLQRQAEQEAYGQKER